MKGLNPKVQTSGRGCEMPLACFLPTNSVMSRIMAELDHGFAGVYQHCYIANVVVCDKKRVAIKNFKNAFT